ncbi:MAG: efflux RND transporter permease subunit [Bacteroidales bacterium]|nr:efflux RND transporter permease subunit [Bacteroidales bacterium]
MLTRLTLKNYQITIAIFVMIALLGVNAFRNMPRSEDPPLNGAFFYAVAVYPGASPGDMEQLVVEPLEEALNELDDIKNFSSSMNDGVALVNVEFNLGVDEDRKYDEVLRQINNNRASLPADLYSLEVYRWSTTNVNILQYALVSENASFADLERQAERLKRVIEKTDAIKKVEVSAYPKQEILIEIDLQKLAQKKIPINNVLAAIQGSNANIPGGEVEMGHRKLNIKTTGNYKTVVDVGNTIVNAANGNIVRLRDLANVSYDYADQQHIGRYNGRRAVFISANQKEGTNIFQVVKSVNDDVNGFIKTIPESMTLVKAFDQSVTVNSRLNRLYEDFGIAILLILITLLPLGTRASLIVMIAIPTSLLIGLTAMYLTGFSINQLSIVGLIISLGLLVDDSIVVVENIVRHMRQGYNRYEATLKATSQISWAVIGCTATMIVAFVPIIMLPGESGEFMKSMPAAVVFTLLASLLVSFTLTPFIASRFLKESDFERENAFLRMLNKVNNGPYQRLLLLGLQYPKTTMLIAVVAVAGSLMLLPVVGFSLFPKAEKPQFLINIEMSPGTSLAYTDSITRKAEKILDGFDEIDSYCTNVGKGNPMIYYNTVQESENPGFAQLFVQLQHYHQQKTPVFLEQLDKSLSCFPGAEITIKEFKNGPPEDAPIEISFFGPNLDTLKRLAVIGENLLKSIEGTTAVQHSMDETTLELKVSVNKDKAGMLGVPVYEIQKTIRMAMAGLSAGNFIDKDGNEYNIRVTLNSANRKMLEDLDKIYIGSLSGAQIPLKQLADVDLQTSSTLIEHYERERSVTVRADVLPGYVTDKVTKVVLARMESIELPDDYRFEPFGEYASRKETFGNMNIAIMVTFFVILLILMLEFHTIKGALIVASSIPLGIIGSILLLLVTGYTFSFSAFVGMISLIGIEVKNSIILVDYANQLRGEGKDIDEAIKTAGQIRFIPIILTTLTAIGGLMPLAVQGSDLFSPLAITIIGGLISSTIFTRVVTPVLYKLVLK